MLLCSSVSCCQFGSPLALLFFLVGTGVAAGARGSGVRSFVSVLFATILIRKREFGFFPVSNHCHSTTVHRGHKWPVSILSVRSHMRKYCLKNSSKNEKYRFTRPPPPKLYYFASFLARIFGEISRTDLNVKSSKVVKIWRKVLLFEANRLMLSKVEYLFGVRSCCKIVFFTLFGSFTGVVFLSVWLRNRFVTGRLFPRVGRCSHECVSSCFCFV